MLIPEIPSAEDLNNLANQFFLQGELENAYQCYSNAIVSIGKASDMICKIFGKVGGESTIFLFTRALLLDPRNMVLVTPRILAAMHVRHTTVLPRSHSLHM